MSWLSDNYEKAALGGAAVVALACGAVIMNNKGSVDESFSRESVKPNNDVSVPGLEKIEGVKESLKKNHHIIRPDLDGRKVDLMTGVPLFAKRGAPETPVDLLKSTSVHADIPNTWWLEHQLDPGYSDSPERDPDEDGFSNREEYVAKTDPNSFGSHPDPITKLKVASLKTTQYHLKPSDFGGGKFKFKLLNARGQERNKMGTDPVAEGQLIEFKDALMKERFKFKKMFEREIKKSGITQKEKIWVIEDLKPNKTGQEYQFNRRGDRIGEGAPQGVRDSVVELNLPALNQDGATFTLEENVHFSLPFDAKAAKKPYLLKKVNVQAKTVEVEYVGKDGGKKSHVMSFAK